MATIRMEPSPEESHDDTIKSVVAVAHRFDIDVVCDVNGITVRTNGYETLESVMRVYTEQVETLRLAQERALPEEDVRVDVYRQGNRVTVRATHLPTGITADSYETASQIKNRNLAVQALTDKVHAANLWG